MQLYMAKVGYDSQLWKVLAESESPLSLDQIAKKTGFDPLLLSKCSEVDLPYDGADISTERVLRYYQSFQMLAQPGDDAYVANNVTKALAGPDGMAAEYL
jgi:demethylsterigmatocystin 6-O-methyltransferase